MPNFELIPFHNTQIMATEQDGEIIVVMKPIVEALGLAWNAQLERIKRHPVLSEGMRVTRIPSAGGEQEVTCLTDDAFHGFLITIQAERISDPGKRDLIIAYQRFVFRLIRDHFAGRHAAPSDWRQRLAMQNQVLKLLGALRRSRVPDERALLHAMLTATCQALRLPVPPLDAIGGNAGAATLCETFWRAFFAAQAAGEKLNVHKNPAKIAFQRGDVTAAFRRQGIDFSLTREVLEALRLSETPRFDHVGAVNTATGTRWCYVFTNNVHNQLALFDLQ